MNFPEDFFDSPAPEESQAFLEWNMQEEYRREQEEKLCDTFTFPTCREKKPLCINTAASEEFVAAFPRLSPRAARCAVCNMRFPKSQLTETGMYEYYTMDIDPMTLICSDCYETARERFVPEDPALFDCFTPVHVS